MRGLGRIIMQAKPNPLLAGLPFLPAPKLAKENSALKHPYWLGPLPRTLTLNTLDTDTEALELKPWM
jgi:hypothetical protein